MIYRERGDYHGKKFDRFCYHRPYFYVRLGSDLVFMSPRIPKVVIRTIIGYQRWHLLKFQTTMTNQPPRYNKNRLIAPANPECVPVPIQWLERLIEINKSTTLTSMDRLQGYVDSAEGFLKKKKEA